MKHCMSLADLHKDNVYMYTYIKWTRCSTFASFSLFISTQIVECACAAFAPVCIYMNMHIFVVVLLSSLEWREAFYSSVVVCIRDALLAIRHLSFHLSLYHYYLDFMWTRFSLFFLWSVWQVDISLYTLHSTFYTISLCCVCASNYAYTLHTAMYIIHYCNMKSNNIIGRLK